MTSKRNVIFFTVSICAALLLSGCDDDDESRFNTAPANLEVFVMHNGADNAGTIERMDANLNALSNLTTDGNEGIAFDIQGNLYVAGDSSAPPSTLQVIANGRSRLRSEDIGSAESRSDRIYTAPDSANFKGIAVSLSAGYVMAANLAGNSIEIYGLAAGEPLSAFASVALPASPWDLAYDEASDTVFIALTNGIVMAVGNFIGNQFSVAGARLITPVTGGDPSNIHGIAYDAERDKLVVSDVGDPNLADDGRIYVIANASTASGSITPERTLAGADTLLGNPVDLALAGNGLYIAEKSNDKILFYADIFSGAGGNVSADLAVDFIKPESIALATTDATQSPDISDLEGNGNSLAAVAVSLNPATPVGSADLLHVDPELGDRLLLFTSGQTLESLKFDRSGHAWLSYDDGDSGGLYIINRAVNPREISTPDNSLDRQITGANTGLISPKGLDIADALGWVIVTENAESDPSVKVFSTGASGDTAPLFSTALPARPWDADYEAGSDQLFVSLVDGTVAVFDNYSQTRGASGADRLITPAIDGSALPAPTNLHGIVYIADSDTLIVSDVGSGAIGTDGKLYVITGAREADGLTEIAITISDGDNDNPGNTLLGNPVDIAYDGQHLYVAEKSQNFILRFDAILDSAGGDVAPSLTMPMTAPESVALVPAFLTPGFLTTNQ